MKRILATLAIGAATVLAVPASATAGVDAVGWYTRNPAAAAPEGGLQVASAPDGVVSYGAISVTEAGETISKATVTLTESGQNLNAAGAKLQACPAAGSLKRGKGTLAEGPKADCLVGKVELARNSSGVWSADVTSVLKGEPAAIAIVPADGAQPFQISFAPPELEVEATTGGSGLDSSFDASEFGGSGGSGGSSSSSGGSGASGSSSDSSFDSGSSGSSGGSSSFDSGGSTSFTPSTFAPAPSGTVAGPEAGPAAVAPEAPAEVVGTEVAGGTNLPSRRGLSATAASASSDGNSGVQFLFFALTAAVIGTGAGFARNRFVTAKG